MNTSHISQLLSENDLGSKLELVKVFGEKLDKTSQTELRSMLIEYIMRSDQAQRVSNFDMVRFYGPGCGLSRFVANQLLLSLNVKSAKQKSLVLNEFSNVLDNFSESKNPLLKVTKAKSLVDLVQRFLGDHFYQITYKRYLGIYFVPLENKISNAAFDINTNSLGVFKTKEKHTQTPEYIFVHEFGHILHSQIFKTSTEVPKSFIEFNRNMNPKFIKFSKDDQLEIYADFFSIAVMLDSDFEDYNPFIKIMHRVYTDEIRNYFVNELTTLA